MRAPHLCACIVPLLVTLIPSCSLVNDIDACDRPAKVEREVNGRTEGRQFVGTDQALAYMPGGRAMVVFTSDTPDGQTTEIRGTMLRADGTAIPSCSAANEATIAVGADAAAIAGPAHSDEAGLVAYVSTATPRRLRATYLSTTGCPVGDPVLVGQEGGDEFVAETPSVTAQGDNVFLVAWTATRFVNGSPVNSLRARLLRGNPVIGHTRFEPSAASPNGDVVDLAAISNPPRGVATAALPNGGTAMAWYEVGLEVTMNLAIYDRDLNRKSVRVIDKRGTMAGSVVPEPPELAVAFDGSQVMVVWLKKETSGGTSAMARFFAPDGQPLSAPGSPDGEPFRLASSSGGQRNPAIAGLDDSGFLVAWEEDAADGDGVGLRGLIFAADGSRRFSNLACDSDPFGLNRITAHDQKRPSLLQMPGGPIHAVWTDSSQSGGDISESAVRISTLEHQDLFP